MNRDRRDLFKKVGMLGASALALVGASKSAKAFEGNENQTPLLGLWDLTFPPPLDALIYKYAISEGGYVATGNQDANPTPSNPYTYSPTMGTYTRTGPNSYRLRERSWVMDPKGNPAGSSEFTGTAVVARDGNSWSGSGTYIQYDLKGKVLLNEPLTYTAVKFPA
jgi:hypothetical protein